MSRIMNAGTPAPRVLEQGRSGDRPFPGEAAWQATRPPRQRAPEQPEPEQRTPEQRTPGQRTPEQHTPGQRAPEQPEPEQPEPTLVVGVDLRGPLPAIAGGAVTRAWLLLRIGSVPIGELLLRVPPEGLTSAEAGAAIAARIGARRRLARRAADGQPRSRRRGRISPL